MTAVVVCPLFGVRAVALVRCWLSEPFLRCGNSPSSQTGWVRSQGNGCYGAASSHARGLQQPDSLEGILGHLWDITLDSFSTCSGLVPWRSAAGEETSFALSGRQAQPIPISLDRHYLASPFGASIGNVVKLISVLRKNLCHAVTGVPRICFQYNPRSKLAKNHLCTA
jgi:hypothetical protein